MTSALHPRPEVHALLSHAAHARHLADRHAILGRRWRGQNARRHLSKAQRLEAKALRLDPTLNDGGCPR